MSFAARALVAPASRTAARRAFSSAAEESSGGGGGAVALLAGLAVVGGGAYCYSQGYMDEFLVSVASRKGGREGGGGGEKCGPTDAHAASDASLAGGARAAFCVRPLPPRDDGLRFVTRGGGEARQLPLNWGARGGRFSRSLAPTRIIPQER